MLDADGDGKLTPEELTHDFDGMLLGNCLRVWASARELERENARESEIECVCVRERVSICCKCVSARGAYCWVASFVRGEIIVQYVVHTCTRVVPRQCADKYTYICVYVPYMYVYVCVHICKDLLAMYTHTQVPQQSNMHCIVSAIDMRESWMVTAYSKYTCAYSKYTCAYTCRISNIWVNTRVGYEIFMHQYLLYAQMHMRVGVKCARHRVP